MIEVGLLGDICDLYEIDELELEEDDEGLPLDCTLLASDNTSRIQRSSIMAAEA